MSTVLSLVLLESTYQLISYDYKEFCEIFENFTFNISFFYSVREFILVFVVTLKDLIEMKVEVFLLLNQRQGLSALEVNIVFSAGFVTQSHMQG